MVTQGVSGTASWPASAAPPLPLRATRSLIVTSSDMNHYQDDETTRIKDGKAIEKLQAVDAEGLYEVCRAEHISMCGLGPAVAMLTAMKEIGAKGGEVVRYATSGDVNGERDAVVGYAGMIFR